MDKMTDSKLLLKSVGKYSNFGKVSSVDHSISYPCKQTLSNKGYNERSCFRLMEIDTRLYNVCCLLNNIMMFELFFKVLL